VSFLAIQGNGQVSRRLSTSTRQHDTTVAGMPPLLGPQAVRQQLMDRPPAAPAEGLGGHAAGQMSHVAGSHDVLSMAEGRNQLMLQSQQQNSNACAAPSSRRTALADASNHAALHATGAADTAGERAESPDPAGNTARATATDPTAEGIDSGSISDNGPEAPAAVGAAMKDDAAGSLVQQCESIFSFL
jgi:hypothetical protein